VADALHADFAAASPMRNRPLMAIAVGGSVVGVLDILYAIVVYSLKRPIRIPQTIAGGLLGLKSYSGGGQTAILGVVLHFFIAFTAAAVYYFASRKLPLLIQRAVALGMIYGGLVYLFMHLIVLPLSALPHGHTRLIYQAAEFIEHLFFVGLPISLSVRHYSQ
jgi:uncharacterized membrane protein YagU involved in acid resistance